MTDIINMAHKGNDSNKQLIKMASPHKMLIAKFASQHNNLVRHNKINLPELHKNKQISEEKSSDINASYTPILPFDFKGLTAHKQFLPILGIFFFSLALLAIAHLNSAKERTPAEFRLPEESADYLEEKVCVDHPDGTKSCTTKTKLKRSFRK